MLAFIVSTGMSPLLVQAGALAAHDITIERIALSVAGVVILDFWRTIRAFREESRLWQARIETALFGANGDNGINGTLKGLVEDVKELQRHAD